MPHYQDGTAARLHDVVRGKPFNTPHEVIGVVVGIEAGESCNMQVTFVGVTVPTKPGTAFPALKLDFGDTKSFTLLDRPVFHAS